MKFAFFNPTVMAVDEVPADVFVDVQQITDKAHQHSELNDEGDPSISVRGGQQIHVYPSQFECDITVLKQYIETRCQQYIQNIMASNGRQDLDEYEPVLASAWTIKQKPGDYQALHNHEAHISGNIYIDIPEFDDNSKAGDGNIEFRLPVVRNPAHLIFVDQWRFQPKPMNMIIFPSYVSHTVYPWQGTGNRTVLAWDCRLVAKGV